MSQKTPSRLGGRFGVLSRSGGGVGVARGGVGAQEGAGAGGYLGVGGGRVALGGLFQLADALVQRGNAMR